MILVAIMVVFVEIVGFSIGIRSPAVLAGDPGKVVVTKKDPNGNILAGACYQVFVNAGNGSLGAPVNGTSKCDRYDEAQNDGRVRYTGIAPGKYVLWEYRSPKGYVVGKRVKFEVKAGQTTNLSVKNTPGGAELRVTTVNEVGTKLANACYGVNKDAGGGAQGELVAGGSDGYDGPPDGVTSIGWLAPGDYVLSQVCATAGHLKAKNRTFHVDAGQTIVKLTVKNLTDAPAGTLVVVKLGPNGKPLGGGDGACFGVFQDGGNGRLGSFVKSRCDAHDGRADGLIKIGDIGAGNYILHESRSPEGHVVGGNTPFVMPADKPKRLSVRNAAGGIVLKVRTKDSAGNLLAGACYQVHLDAGGGALGNFVAGGCDGQDGYGPKDGTNEFRGLPPGNYVLMMGTPPAGFPRASKKRFAITADQTARSLTIQYPAAQSAGFQAAEAPTTTAEVPTATATPTEEDPPEATATATETPTPEPTATDAPHPTEEPEPTAEQTEVV
ncbi:MAG: hypothetical protein QOF33_3400 [Thermomicrobiales bacterium]|nr:hypothetical protein [Thermomicrobiales bacterium]